ncbi:hypothetical protein FQN57_006968 [Myotisia sp. PD_48]|nr:hypothetical protein FQN57_006968 [Myotisia sp. PD_48]
MGETIAIVATQDITVGEEITFCYSPDFSARTSHSRRQQLRFVCKCKACLQGTPFQQLSDIRRTLIRGLYYLAFDKGLDGETQTEALSIIFDTKLKSEVENSTIPLSKRFVSALLAMFLLEEEGLLDNLRIKDIYPSVLEMKDMFRTEANAKHSLLAVSQETWLEKFIVAARMYGRTDSVDRHYNAALRAKT